MNASNFASKVKYVVQPKFQGEPSLQHLAMKLEEAYGKLVS